MGNIVFSTATGVPSITPDQYLHDDRPLTVINYKKAEIPRIETDLLSGYTPDTCPLHLVVIDDSTNLAIDDGATICEYGIYNNLGGKVKITLGSTWQQVFLLFIKYISSKFLKIVFHHLHKTVKSSDGYHWQKRHWCHHMLIVCS